MVTERVCGECEAGPGTIAGRGSCALTVAADQPFIQELIDQLPDLALELFLRDLELGEKPGDELRLGRSVPEQLPEPRPRAIQLEDPIGSEVDEHGPVI